MNWFNKPSKKQFILIFTIWLISISLFLVGSTDMFTKKIPLTLIFLVVVPATLVVITTFINYRKNNSSNK